MRRFVVLAVLVLAALGCSSEEDARDPGCELWTELLAGDTSEVSDARAGDVANEIAGVTEDDDVRVAAQSLSERLVGNQDIQLEFAALSDACGLDD